MAGIEFAGKRVYLSGPMTGIANWNRESFDEAARYLRSMGAKVFNPAFNLPTGEPLPHGYYMARDIHELTDNMNGKPFYDILAQLPGWDKSNGAQVEMIVAKACGIEVVSV
ncbi:MAG: DUF4406 domain-containing protein [Eggerthellaceae bacterium]|nr:DUF4406 domain-containing protein [Eggerthellaceae bacterium]